jgi:hypothetical protein
MIIGVSAYDLNEHQLCDSRAHIVPLGQTIKDLWHSKVGWQFSKRVLSQYPLALTRTVFPTAGRSDAVLVGLRRKARGLVGLSASAEDKGNSLVLPTHDVMDFGDSTEKLSDWPKDKILRRLALQRSLIQGKHAFVGPKRLALLRMLNRAKGGRVIVAVMPVAPTYGREFLTPEVNQSFEKELEDAIRVSPDSLIVRLDKLPALQSDEYFSDFVHLNGAGRRIATEAFLKELKHYSATR